MIVLLVIFHKTWSENSNKPNSRSHRSSVLFSEVYGLFKYQVIVEFTDQPCSCYASTFKYLMKFIFTHFSPTVASPSPPRKHHQTVWDYLVMLPRPFIRPKPLHFFTPLAQGYQLLTTFLLSRFSQPEVFFWIQVSKIILKEKPHCRPNAV